MSQPQQLGQVPGTASWERSQGPTRKTPSYHQATGPSPSSNNNLEMRGASAWELGHLGVCLVSVPL